MKQIQNLKILFRTRALFGILALIFFCSPQTPYICIGMASLIILWMIDDFRTIFWNEIGDMASEDRPE